MVRPFIPPALKKGAFTRAQALSVGLSVMQLERGPYRRISRGVYAWRELRSPEVDVDGALLRLPESCVFSGYTAAWLHGMDVDGRHPVEVTLRKGGGISARAGLAVRRHQLTETDIKLVRGYRVTSICRTLRDLAARISRTEAVVLLDMALQIGLTDLSGLLAWIDRNKGSRGVGALRDAAALAEPLSESPMETRLRMLLIQGGLERPLAQVPLKDSRGEFLARADLYYPKPRLCLEYDGATHKDSLADDNRRQNRLLVAGYRLLRFTAADINAAPERVVTQVRSYLSAA